MYIYHYLHVNVCTYPAPWESLTVGVGSFLCKQLPALTQQNLPANCNNHAWVRFAENLRKICWIIGRKAACVHHTKPALQKLPVAVKTNQPTVQHLQTGWNTSIFDSSEWPRTGLIFYIKLPNKGRPQKKITGLKAIQELVEFTCLWEHFSDLVDLAMSLQYPCTPCGHSGEQKWGLSTKLCISIVWGGAELFLHWYQSQGYKEQITKQA